MPGIRHEAVVDLVHRFPQLAAVLLRSVQVPVPAGPVREVDSNLSARRPLSFAAESVFLHGEGKQRLAVVVEVQTRPPSRAKWRDWVAYQAIAGHEYDCDAVVLVVALRRETARRSRRPFRTGPHNQMNVVAVGPDDLPEQVPGLAAELTVLAAVTGALDLERSQDQVTVLDAIAGAAVSDRARYTGLILALASEQARAELEVLMATAHKETLVDRLLDEGRAEGEARGRAEGEARGRAEGEARGRAEGEANLLLRVLRARGLAVPADVRDMITSCVDTAQLEAWFDRAITATSLDDVFGGQ
jgi:hypothetical protein